MDGPLVEGILRLAAHGRLGLGRPLPRTLV